MKDRAALIRAMAKTLQTTMDISDILAEMFVTESLTAIESR